MLEMESKLNIWRDIALSCLGFKYNILKTSINKTAKDLNELLNISEEKILNLEKNLNESNKNITSLIDEHNI